VGHRIENVLIKMDEHENEEKGENDKKKGET
jgi:hypothetical protein